MAAVTAATIAFTKGLVDGIAQTAAYGDNVDKMSQKMGISAEAYQEWDAIMQHSGASIDSMQRGMTTLSKAAENGSDAFQKLGLTQEQVASMNQEELFAATIAGLQGMEEGTERTVLAQELLGGSAKELGALLNTSAEETEEMRQRVHELGGVMSGEAVKAAAAYQDSLQDMQTAFTGLTRGLLIEFMPSITTVMDGLTEIFAGDSDKGIAMISEGVEKIVNTISNKLPEFLALGSGILNSIVRALLNNMPQLLESGGQLVGKLIAGIISAIPKIITMIPKIIVAIVNGLAAAWPEIQAAGVELLDMLKAGMLSVLSQILAIGAQIIENIRKGISNKFSELVNLGRSVVDQIKAGISAKWSELTSWFINIWDSLFKNRRVDIDVSATNSTSAPGHAIGLDYVPTNRYLAELHRGEAVLTAREADQWRRGESGQVINLYIDGIKYNTDSYIDGAISGFVTSMVQRSAMFATGR